MQRTAKRETTDEGVDVADAKRLGAPEDLAQVEAVLTPKVGLQRLVVVIYEVPEADEFPNPYSSMSPPTRSCMSSMEGFVATKAS